MEELLCVLLKQHAEGNVCPLLYERLAREAS